MESCLLCDNFCKSQLDLRGRDVAVEFSATVQEQYAYCPSPGQYYYNNMLRMDHTSTELSWIYNINWTRVV